jgi:hypothetical protein
MKIDRNQYVDVTLVAEENGLTLFRKLKLSSDRCSKTNCYEICKKQKCYVLFYIL